MVNFGVKEEGILLLLLVLLSFRVHREWNTVHEKYIQKNTYSSELRMFVDIHTREGKTGGI